MQHRCGWPGTERASCFAYYALCMDAYLQASITAGQCLLMPP